MASQETFEMAPFVEKASRLELIIRWVYGIVIQIIYGLWGIFIAAIHFLQFFHILIFGRRGARLYKYSRRYLTATTYVSAYLMFLTDERPELIPDLLAYFRKASPETPPSVPPVAGAKFCASCGAQVPADVKFCGSCGAKQS
jgi:hypothetical protein